MVKRVLFGILWFVVIYFAACTIVGAVAGGIAGFQDPANATALGSRVGREVVEANKFLILGGSALLSFIGTGTGILPGTRKNPHTGA